MPEGAAEAAEEVREGGGALTGMFSSGAPPPVPLPGAVTAALPWGPGTLRSMEEEGEEEEGGAWAACTMGEGDRLGVELLITTPEWDGAVARCTMCWRCCCCCCIEGTCPPPVTADDVTIRGAGPGAGGMGRLDDRFSA